MTSLFLDMDTNAKLMPPSANNTECNWNDLHLAELELYFLDLPKTRCSKEISWSCLSMASPLR